MENYLIPLYVFAFVCYALAGAFRLLRYTRAELFLALTAVTANGAALVFMTLATGHLPIFNLFESFLLVAFVLGCLGVFCTVPPDRIFDVRMWVWLEILLVFGITLFFPKRPSPFLYDHDYTYIVLFFGFRLIALATMLFSSAHYLQFRLERRRLSSANNTLHRGRNYLVLSAVIFLTAEYVGIIWCQRGWGHFWMWNEGFLQSTLIVLYLMLAFHLPGKSQRWESIRSSLGGMSGFVMLILSVIRGLE
jgi:hypothetical protein